MSSDTLPTPAPVPGPQAAVSPAASRACPCSGPAPAPALDAVIVPAAAATTTTIDLADPYWFIEHIARAVGLEVDSARELTYRGDFPEPIKVGRRWVWFPDEVHAYLRKQDRHSTADRKRRVAADVAVAQADKPLKPYKPRNRETAQAAA